MAESQAPILQWVRQFSADPANNYSDILMPVNSAGQQGNVYSAAFFFTKWILIPDPGFSIWMPRARSMKLFIFRN